MFHPSPMKHTLHSFSPPLPILPTSLQALYRGNGANVLRLVPEVGFKFIVHDQFKIMFAPADGSPLGVAEKLAAGAATGTRGREKSV